ncbi:hypothetical protein [Algibacter sp. L1A34]|uniref:hypothetical protein n=1 Tax=Algibacter sp. L1A34 TaxID=2686365 RepID=UPI00131BAD33|nr:hypothetical protein [Algibacter sp. L1A34]
MYYYFIIAFQVYCIYHMYKNGNSFYWALLIFFVPLIGCIIYLVTQVYNKRDAEKITSEITNIINPTKKIRDLEKQLEFSESYQNRVNLADAYLANKDYNNALPLYLKELKDGYENDFYVNTKLVEAYFLAKDYSKAVFYAEKIKDKLEYKKSKTQFICGLAYEKLGDFEAAEHNLRQIDIRYSFYEERLVFAEFLINRNKKEEARTILEAIKTESQHMTKPNQKLYRRTVVQVEKLLSEFD